TDLRRQVLRRLVQVNRRSVTLEGSNAAQLDLFAEGSGLRVDEVGNGCTVDGGCEALLCGRCASGGNGLENLVGKSNELVVLCNEVGLARELNHRDNAGRFLDGNEALAG